MPSKGLDEGDVFSLYLQADRITLSKLTIFYFVFSILHCLIQVVFQVEAFKINETAANFLNSVIIQGNVSEAGFTVYSDNKLRWCTSVPDTLNPDQCQVVWNGTQAINNATAFLNNGAGSGQMSEYPVDVASLPASSASSSSSVLSSSTLSAQLSSSASSISSTASSSSVAPVQSSASVVRSSSLSTSARPSSSATSAIQTVTEIPLAQALASLEAGDLFLPTETSEVAVTVTVKVAPTSSATTDDDDHEHRKVLSDSTVKTHCFLVLMHYLDYIAWPYQGNFHSSRQRYKGNPGSWSSRQASCRSHIDRELLGRTELATSTCRQH